MNNKILILLLVAIVFVSGCAGNNSKPADQPASPAANNTAETTPADTTPAAAGTTPEETTQTTQCAWQEYSGNPIIKFGDSIPVTVWNDPSVIKEGSVYRMWLSGGDPTVNPIVARVYEATSADGINWNINKNPQLSPSTNPDDWDSLRIETPSVIKVGNTYHMYYSGCDANCQEDGKYSIGHATSPDGIVWTKDQNNPIIIEQGNLAQWGSYGAAEPGIVYNPKDGKFYLYYVSLKFENTNPPIGHYGILLSTSADGSNFSPYADSQGNRQAVLAKNIDNAPAGSWFGYTNPMAFISASGQFNLFYSLIVAPGGPSTGRTAALEHAVSDDGINFIEDNGDIFTFNKNDWKNQNVRAPTAIEENGDFKMWFAGETETPNYMSGIGYATCK